MMGRGEVRASLLRPMIYNFRQFMQFSGQFYSYAVSVTTFGVLASLVAYGFSLVAGAGFTWANWVLLGALAVPLVLLVIYGFVVLRPRYRRSLEKSRV